MDKIKELEKGAFLQSQNRFTEAEEIYKKVINKFPDFPETYNLLGLIHSETSDLSKAQTFFTQALQREAQRADFHYNQAECFRLNQSITEAIQSYSRAINLKHNFKEAYINRALCFIEVKKYQASIDDLQKAIALDPSSFEAYFNLGTALTRACPT